MVGEEGRHERGQRLVVDSAGAGNPTVARAVAGRTGIAYIEPDALSRRPDRGETPDVEFLSGPQK